MTAWLDGALVDGAAAPFDLTDRGLTLGDGVFETLPLFAGKPFLLDEHLSRMAQGAQLLGFSLASEKARAAVRALARRVPKDPAALRLTLTRGSGARGLAPPEAPKPRLFGVVAPWSAEIVGRPLALATSAIRRNASSPAARTKSLAYLDNILAHAAAREAGADDALLLTTDGHVASTTMANLFLLVDGALVTPPVADGVLPGITRAVVLAEAERLGLHALERSVAPEELAAAEGLITTNSLRLASPVATLDGRAFGAAGQEIAARINARLRELILATCGVDPLGG